MIKAVHFEGIAECEERIPLFRRSNNNNKKIKPVSEYYGVVGIQTGIVLGFGFAPPGLVDTFCIASD